MLFSRKKSSLNKGFNKKSSEFAKVIEWEPRWSSGAPLPQVFSNGNKVYLLYYIETIDPDWDGSYVTPIDNKSEMQQKLALVEFHGSTFRFGIANDEVFSGLPLSQKGLKYYEAHIIENSSWIDELKSIHKVHPNYNEKNWTNKIHYMFLFHDELFEVIATGYKIETFELSFKDLAILIAKRMNSA
jgi:hypothetical protein